MSAASATSPGEYRALLVVDHLPAGCIAVPVRDEFCAPHIRPGEFAVVDPTDREPVHGELFLGAWMGRLGPDGRERRWLAQTRMGEHDILGRGRVHLWSIYSLGGLRGQEAIDALHVGSWSGFAWSSGPYDDGVLEEMLLGRVVGVILRLPAAALGATGAAP